MRKPDRAEYEPLQLFKSNPLADWVFDFLPYELYSDDAERSDFLTIEQFRSFLKALLSETEGLLAGDPFPENERITLRAIKNGGVTIEVELTYEESSSDVDKRYEADLKRYEDYRCWQIQQIERDIALRQSQLAELKG